MFQSTASWQNLGLKREGSFHEYGTVFFYSLASSVGKLLSRLYRMLFHLPHQRVSECLPAKHYVIQLTSAMLILSFILTPTCACLVVGFRSTCCHVSVLQKIICASNSLLNNLHIDPARPLWFMAWNSENWTGGMKLLWSCKTEIIIKSIRISLSLCLFLCYFSILEIFNYELEHLYEKLYSLYFQIIYNLIITDLVFWYIKAP